MPSENGKLPFPAMSELNARLRRIVAAFQKSHKKELLKQEQNEKVRVHAVCHLHDMLVDASCCSLVYLAENICQVNEIGC